MQLSLQLSTPTEERGERFIHSSLLLLFCVDIAFLKQPRAHIK
jgi:hypothetical protein